MIKGRSLIQLSLPKPNPAMEPPQVVEPQRPVASRTSRRQFTALRFINVDPSGRAKLEIRNAIRAHAANHWTLQRREDRLLQPEVRGGQLDAKNEATSRGGEKPSTGGNMTDPGLISPGPKDALATSRRNPFQSYARTVSGFEKFVIDHCE